MAPSRGVFAFRASPSVNSRPAALDFPLHLAQRRGDEVHAVDQLAQFRAHLLAVLPFMAREGRRAVDAPRGKLTGGDGVLLD